MKDIKKHFEANMLDGDLVEDCGKSMLSAESVFEYIKETFETPVTPKDKTRCELCRDFRCDLNECKHDCHSELKDNIEECGKNQHMTDDTPQREEKCPSTSVQGWTGFLGYINSLSPWNMWTDWNSQKPKQLKVHLEMRLKDLLSQELQRQREDLLRKIKLRIRMLEEYEPSFRCYYYSVEDVTNILKDLESLEGKDA